MIIDSGNTCQSCCSYINLMPSKDIFTVSIGAFEQLDGNLHNVFLTPGKKREKNQSIVGHWSEEYLDKVQVDVCVLGTSGLLNSDGPTCHSYQELGVKKKMIEKVIMFLWLLIVVSFKKGIIYSLFLGRNRWYYYGSSHLNKSI